ncbi:MAG TPA: 1-acyl-sn-glycerol-3-phosphate acyltransferase [Chitinophagales bacterium]|nr:1-acyl-sn-glycerol-3-phosphate acyltransferase [Chitinophagales bacterium]
MNRWLLNTYDFFEQRKGLFYAFTVSLFVLLGLMASLIRPEEDINKLLPNSEQTRGITDIFKSSNFADKVVVKVIARKPTEPEVLMAYADTLNARLLDKYTSQISDIKLTVSDETTLAIYNTVHDNLPVYLEEADYKAIDTLISPERIPQTLQEDYNIITSAQGMVMKRLIADDPVGISNLALRKLQNLQTDDNYQLYDGYIMGKDQQSLYMFITLNNTSGQTAQNEKLFNGFDAEIASLTPAKDSVEILYYGNSVVAAGNARQLKKDSIITLSITIVAILLFVGLFFRRKRVPVIMMLPVVFGGLFSIAIIAVTKGTISSIALGAGSIVLGIAINYSLHFFSHYKHCGSVKQTITDLLSPMTIGSITTVGSFFSLTLLQSQILNDFGLFAALSLMGATIFALVFLPHFMPPASADEQQQESRLEKLLNFKIKYQGAVFLIVLALTGFFFYHARHVGFESDLNKVNFLNEETRRAQKEIDVTQDDSSKVVFIASNGATQEEMLQNNEVLLQQLEEAQQKGWIQKYSSFSRFIPSQKLQEEKIKTWNAYWTPDKKKALIATLKLEGSKLKFAPAAFANFEALLTKEYAPVGDDEFGPIKEAFGKEYLIYGKDKQTVINAVRVDKAQRKQLYAELNKHPSTVILDKQIITNKFVEIIYSDFNSVLLYTSTLVFFALLFSYGRLELTLITFLPMVITWIWVLGIVGLFGIQFNLINIVISTFIFGLGDDFSIFITDGLTEKYKKGKNTLASHKVSIFLSAVTILIGLGALIFAKHPALKSIALLSIVGIFCVVVVGQTVQPYLYNFFIQSRKDRGLPPWTISTLILTWIAFGYYVSVSLFAALVGYILLYLVPYPGIKKRKLFFHYIVRGALWVLTYMMVNVRKRHEGKSNMDFSKPAVIIANHASFLDILVTVMQHPKLILLTNKWVYYSPVFGKVVQLADYYPVMEGADAATEKFVDIVKDGYSIVVFPEGTRSPDGRLKRFHKGAFYLAEQLNIDIVPMLLHGTGDTIRKGDFMVMNASMTMKFLPRISPADARFGNGYAERTKGISRYFKTEYEKLREEKETPRYFRQWLRMNYIYKGPELEFLALKESRSEAFYTALDKALPKQGHITEIGCGYGFHVYMLHFTGWKRTLTGIDTNEEMIEIANNCYSKNSQLQFIHADVTQCNIPQSNAIIINQKNLPASVDVKSVLEKCAGALLPGGKLIYIGSNVALATYTSEEIYSNMYLMKGAQ